MTRPEIYLSPANQRSQSRKTDMYAGPQPNYPVLLLRMLLCLLFHPQCWKGIQTLGLCWLEAEGAVETVRRILLQQISRRTTYIDLNSPVMYHPKPSPNPQTKTIPQIKHPEKNAVYLTFGYYRCSVGQRSGSACWWYVLNRLVSFTEVDSRSRSCRSELTFRCWQSEPSMATSR